VGENEAEAAGSAVRSVLVPADFSEGGLAALPYAVALVGRGGHVHLLHVIEAASVPNPLYSHYKPGRVPSAEERARQASELEGRLAELAIAEAEARGARVTVLVREETDVVSAICALAEELDVDAICISSHGRGGLARALLGSVAERVLASARRPVLLVRPRID
jgi:nucleotide-binding universal stress UspA family protein